MSKNVIIGVLLLVTGILIGVNLLRCRRSNAKGAAAGAAADLGPVAQEVATLRQLVPTNSTIMMDVQWHWTNLWWAGKKRNWPLAQYYFNESRGHIQQLVRKNPTIRNQVDGTDVELQGIFDGIDTSSLAMVKDAIEKKDGARVREELQDHARELLLLPQERGTSVHPAADSDSSGAGDGQHGPQRDMAAVIAIEP